MRSHTPASRQLLIITIVLTAMASPVTMSGACPSFAAVVNHATGSAPAAVAIGDFNGDGRRDLAVANNSSANVSIMLATGGGNFAAAVNYAAGSAPTAVAIGDFNGDGKADLAVANNGSANVSILLGNGNGTFATAVNYAAGTNPTAVSVGDFNRDGKLDLAVGNAVSNNVSILIGNGNGTFAAAVNYASGSGPRSIAVGDFNGDGKADLAVANFASNNVSILIGAGNGTFAAAVNYAAGGLPQSVAAGDFNGDGKQDLAVANISSSNVSVLIGSGTGTFAAAVNYAAGSGAFSVAVGDVNGDGKPDLAVANDGADNVSLLLGTGTGTFAAAVNYATDGGPASVAFGDLNGDGKADIVVANSTGNDVSVLLNTSYCTTNCGTFGAVTNYSTATGPFAITSADFNGDGKLDVAVANTGSDNVSVLLGSGSGAFAAAVNYAVGTYPHSVVVGDFNRDGRIDLAVANSNSNNVSILLGNGNGTFAAAVNYTLSGRPLALSPGDFDGDGVTDLAVTAEDTFGAAAVSILIGNSNGTFASPVNYGTFYGAESIASADFNGDGKLDLAVTSANDLQSHDVAILLGVGDGTFAGAVYSGANDSPWSVAVGDFNGDGKADLAVANTASNDVSVLLGSGNGTFATAVNYANGAGMSPISVATGDFNGDGRADLLIGNNATNFVSILLGNGDGTFAAAVNYATNGNVGSPGNPVAVVIGDFNRDGKPDFATANYNLGGIAILLNSCPPPDLTLTKTHVGTFTQGDTGKTYTITANNAGTGPTNQPVTVLDALPAHLTATAISGTGWSCNLPTLSCTRSDSLAGASSYPPITLTVNLASNTPASVTNNATIAGGGELNVANDSVSDPATVSGSGVIAPTNLVATAASTSQVNVNWDTVTGATSYQVFRSFNNGAFVSIGTPATNSLTDSGLSANTTYLYQVRAVGGIVGPFTPIDLATTIIFTNDPLIAGVTIVRAPHLAELRVAVNAVLAAAGQPAATFSGSIAPGAPIMVAHINELRSNLNLARSILGVSAIQYTDPALAAGVTIKAAHVQELRSGVK